MYGTIYMKILQLNKLYYPVTGGVEHVVQQIAEGLNKYTDMKVLVCQEKGNFIQEDINGVAVIRTGSLGVKFSLPLSPGYIKAVRHMSSKCDVLLLHMPFPLGDLALLMSGYKGRVVLWWHSDIVRQKKLMKLYRPLMEWTLKRADAIVVATEGHIEGSKYLKPFKNKCRVIPFGVSREIYEDAEIYNNINKNIRVNDYLRATNKQQITFLFVGRLVYYKGVDILVEAFSIAVKTSDVSMNLKIIGSGPLEDFLKQQAKALGVAEYIEFIGKVDDRQLMKAYRNCDVFILPSVARSEAFGLVQIEAMAYGKPVINTWLDSGVPYVSINEQTGLTVPPGNYDALADAIKRMAEDNGFRNKCGINARQRVSTEYREDIMMKRLIEVLK